MLVRRLMTFQGFRFNEQYVDTELIIKILEKFVPLKYGAGNGLAALECN